MLPFGPSDLPWALWIVCAAGFSAVALMIYANLLDQKRKSRGEIKSVFVGLILGTVLFICVVALFFSAIYGLIEFSNLK